jgi:sulfate adenylyltransferase subunit 1
MSAIESITLDNAGVLRFTTAGSVDDGKSTLIGRLLYDTRSIFEDQLSALERASLRRNGPGLDLSLLTDGLIAEREQGITIDVAYRYFATPARKFIIADTPGHEQYTRNMVTGASTANLAVVLVDASKGITSQSRRHACIAGLLRIPHLVVAVNKMDLAGYSRQTFERIRDAFREFASGLEFHRVDCLPLSALYGDMVVERGDRMPWYRGGTLLEILETAHTAGPAADGLFFPVQLVARPEESGRAGYRGYRGRIESGSVRVGDAVTVLPAGRITRVRGIRVFEGAVEAAHVPQSVTLFLEDQLDVSRGDVIVKPDRMPRVTLGFEATLCWLAEEPLARSRRYLVKHGTRTVKALLGEPAYRLNVDTLEREPADTLALNEIGRVPVTTGEPLAWEPYRENRAAGSFIVIDESSNDTVAAGLIE